MSLSEASTMARNRNLRMAGVEATPEIVFVRIYNRATGPETTLSRQPQPRAGWQLEHNGQTYALHRAKDALRITHIGSEPARRVRDRYTLDGRFAPEPGDSVVDVGAFVGELSWQLADIDGVSDITAIEPDPRNARCARANTPDSVAVEQCGAYHDDGEIEFNIARDGTESGILSPDKGKSQTMQAPVRRLDSILDDAPNWLKVEAEGNEPEVLLGLGELRPEKIVVNVSPERNGASPVSMCDGLLTEWGYQTEQRGDELFAAYNGAIFNE